MLVNINNRLFYQLSVKKNWRGIIIIDFITQWTVMNILKGDIDELFDFLNWRHFSVNKIIAIICKHTIV